MNIEKIKVNIRENMEYWAKYHNVNISHKDYESRVNEYIKNRFRVEINSAIKRRKNTKHFTEIVGCDIEEYINYIESMFSENMSWDNRSRTTWHIDHIIPLIDFDMTDRECWKICFNYLNTQPIDSCINQIKGGKSLNENVKKLVMYRIKNKLTQRELSEEINIPLKTIQNWEQGIREPDSRYLESIKKFNDSKG